MGSADRGLIRSSGFRPSTSPGFSRSSAQPITPSRSFPRKRHLTGELGLCRDRLPIALPLRHHGPNDACHLVGQSNGDHEAGSSGQQALDPGIGSSCLRAQQDGLRSDDQQLTDVLVAEPGRSPDRPARARMPVSPASRRSPRARSHSSRARSPNLVVDDAHRGLGLRDIQSSKGGHGSSPLRLTRSRATP